MDVLLKIATAYAEEFCNSCVEPAHIFKALLHKDVGLVNFIERNLDKDYYYLLDWADVQIQMTPRAARPVRNPELSKEAAEVMREADSYRDKFGLDETDAVCVLAASVTPGVGFSFDQLKTLPLAVADICNAYGKSEDVSKPSYTPVPGAAPKGSSGGGIEKYCIDKVKQAVAGELGVVIGFEKEIEIIFETLGRKTKSNLLVTGEPGVGKSALISAFATRIANGQAPDFLKGALVYELDLASLGSDAQYKGEIEDRFKNVVRTMETRRSSGAAVLVIESVDKLFDKTSAMFGCSAILKQEISTGGLQLLCTASIDGFTKHMETDKEIMAKLGKLTVEEPDAALCLEILKGALPAYESFHKISVSEEVMKDGIRLAKRYMNEKALPDSAFDLLDRTMSAVKIANDASAQKQDTVELHSSDMEAVVAKQTGIPLGKVQTSERDKLLGAEQTLKERVIGQDQAIKSVVDSVFESRSGLNKKGQPMGSFFFLGPTGTGKTELSKALAAFLFGDESALLRFDMSEFKEEHSVALLYGAPPGYVGYEEGGLLVNKIRQNPYSVVLFDEIEKAHKSVFDLFLQILDEGKLHDRLGRVGDFSNALILFTSNIGSQFISEKFQQGTIPSSKDMMDIMQQYFRPEFLARLTEIVPFSPITENTVVQIFDIHLKGLLKLLSEQNIKLEMPYEAKAAVAMRGFDPKYGARQIIGNIRKELRHPLSKLIIAGKIKSGDTVEVVLSENGETEFRTK